jgi:hypothetical protein
VVPDESSARPPGKEVVWLPLQGADTKPRLCEQGDSLARDSGRFQKPKEALVTKGPPQPTSKSRETREFLVGPEARGDIHLPRPSGSWFFPLDPASTQHIQGGAAFTGEKRRQAAPITGMFLFSNSHP